MLNVVYSIHKSTRFSFDVTATTGVAIPLQFNYVLGSARRRGVFGIWRLLSVRPGEVIDEKTLSINWNLFSNIIRTSILFQFVRCSSSTLIPNLS